MGTLALQLKYLRKQRPIKARPKRPITQAIIALWLPHLGSTLKNITIRTALAVAYAHMLRAGEYTCSLDSYRIDNRFRLNWQDIEFGYDSEQNPVILKICIKLPKSFGYKFKQEYTISQCTCTKLPFCALHLLLQLWKLVTPANLSTPVFLINGSWLTPTQMRNAITELCVAADLDATFYTCHGFRSGACTDLKLNGTDDTIICKLGRWSSDMWKEHYLLLDLFDVLRLTK